MGELMVTGLDFDGVIRTGWLASVPAIELAEHLKVPLGCIGLRVVELKLPARDHHRQILVGTVVTPTSFLALKTEQ